MKIALTALSFSLAAATASAAPISDGSIYFEQFTGNVAGDAKTNVIGVGASISSEAGQIVTTDGGSGTEGVVRAGTGLGIAAGTEVVIEYDLTINASSGNNFYGLLTQDSGAPYKSLVNIRVFNDSGAGDWEFQVDHGGSPGYTSSNLDLAFGQSYHFTVHRTANINNDVVVYVDGNLFTTVQDVNPSLGIDFIQFGDGSAGDGFGSATVDNISIGLVPEPGALALLGLGVIAVVGRRETSMSRA